MKKNQRCKIKVFSRKHSNGYIYVMGEIDYIRPNGRIDARAPGRFYQDCDPKCIEPAP